MKKYKFFAGFTIASIFMLVAVLVTTSGLVTNALSNIFRSSPASTDYKLVLNVDNQATEAEVGTWNDSSKETNQGIRYTQLGNPVNIAFASGKGVTRNSEATFCQMPGTYNGWFTNTTPLRGITSIKLTVLDSGSKFVVDTSFSTVMTEYSYSSSVPEGVTRSAEYTGSKSYTINFSGEYNYFRIQNTGGGALGPTSCEICFNCFDAHAHDEFCTYIEHQANPAFRDVDGNIAYKECSICHKLFDSEYHEIELEDTFVESYYYEFSEGNAKETRAFPATLSDTVVFDLKLEDPVSSGIEKRVDINFQDNDSNRTGNIRFYSDGTFTIRDTDGMINKGYTFVTYVGLLTDGYLRFSIDLSKAPRESNLTEITQIAVHTWNHTSGSFEANPGAGVLCYGEQFTAGNDVTIANLNKNYQGLTINLDIHFTSDSSTKMRIFFGDNWDNFFGYFRINANKTLNEDYDGVTLTDLGNGYIRVSFHFDLITTKSGSPQKINLFYIQGKNTTGSGYYQLNYVDNLVHHDAVTPFRGVGGNIEYYTCSVCDKYFDSTYAETTAQGVVRQSAFYSFNNTDNPQGAGNVIAEYNIPSYKQLNYGDTFTIDFKLENISANSEIGFLIGDSPTNYFGKFWVERLNFNVPKLQGNYGSGVTSAFTSDGYLRVSVVLDTTKIASGRQGNYSGITKFTYVKILSGESYKTCTGTVEILPESGTIVTGTPFAYRKQQTISLSEKLIKSTGIILLDVNFFTPASENLRIRIGNDSVYNGNYELYPTTKNGDYTGITVSNLTNNFIRFTINLSLLNVGTSPTDEDGYTKIIIPDWSKADGLLNVTTINTSSSPSMEDIY